METKLELSANLIIETEFIRRKLFRVGNSQEQNEFLIWKLDDSREFGLTRIFEGLWGRSILSKSRIIEEIRGLYLNKYDFELAEQELETAGGFGSDFSSHGGPSLRELQNLLERELKRQQTSLLRELKRDLEPIAEAIEDLNDAQNDSAEAVSSKIENLVRTMSEDIKKFVPSEEQARYQQKLNSLMQMNATRRKVAEFDRELDELRSYMGRLDRRMGNYREFIEDTPLDSIVDLRRRGRQAKR